MTNEELARAAVLNVVKLMAIKWTAIIVINKISRRAVS